MVIRPYLSPKPLSLMAVGTFFEVKKKSSMMAGPLQKCVGCQIVSSRKLVFVHPQPITTKVIQITDPDYRSELQIRITDQDYRSRLQIRITDQDYTGPDYRSG